MKFSALIEDKKLLPLLDASLVEEIVIPCNGFSREGGLSELDAIELHEEAQNAGFSTVLLADRLLEERHFYEYAQKVFDWSQRTQVRVQDTGIAYWLKAKGVSFQLSLEVGNANTLGIEGWLEVLSPAVAKVVLNNQIPREHLLPIIEELEVPTEILGLGPILMYYTPRKLLSFQDILDEKVEAVSEETGTKTFRFRESAAGTVMYFSKELCLLSHQEELDKAGLRFLRLDFRDATREQVESALIACKMDQIDDLKEVWPYALLTGYYKTNKSDAIFKHLPKKRKEEESLAVAEILDSSENQLLIRALQDFKTEIEVQAVNTKNKSSSWSVSEIKDLNGENLPLAKDGDLLFIQKPAKFLPGTFIYSAPMNANLTNV